MADYICREDVIKKIAEQQDKAMYGIADVTFYRAIKIIKGEPAADVQPVKHGYWIKQPEKFQIYEDVINSNYLYSCSCCNASDLHSERANNDGEVKFCWRCGARMDGDTNG